MASDKFGDAGEKFAHVANILSGGLELTDELRRNMAADLAMGLFYLTQALEEEFS